MIGWLVAKGLSRVAAKAILGIAIAVTALIVASIWLAARDRETINKYENAVGAKTERAARSADQEMMLREQQRRAQERQEREVFNDATSHIPNEGLTRRQRLDLCLELRDAGTDTTRLPQCSDLHSGGPTNAITRHTHQR